MNEDDDPATTRVRLGATAVLVVGTLVLGALLVPRLVAATQPPSAPAAGSLATCTDLQAIDFGCFERYYHDLAHHSGAPAAFADLRAAHEQSGFVRIACHYLTHTIGHGVGDDVTDVATAYRAGDPFCAGGYFHGVIGGIVKRIGLAGLPAAIDGLCEPLRAQKRQGFQHYSCAHGLGHGFVALHSGDLDRALVTCDTLSDPWERDACYGGVFIENVALTSKGTSTYARAGEPLYPCTAVAGPYKNQCYEKQVGMVLWAADNDYAAVFAQCAGVLDGGRSACFQGLGASAAAHAVKYVGGFEERAHAAANLCMTGADPAARTDCLVGAVRNLIHYRDNDAAAERLCAVVDPEYAQPCNTARLDEILI